MFPTLDSVGTIYPMFSFIVTFKITSRLLPARFWLRFPRFLDLSDFALDYFLWTCTYVGYGAPAPLGSHVTVPVWMSLSWLLLKVRQFFLPFCFGLCQFENSERYISHSLFPNCRFPLVSPIFIDGRLVPNPPPVPILDFYP